MKFAASRKDLARGIHLALRALSARADMPVLASVLVEAGEGPTGDDVSFTCTDLRLTITATVPGLVAQPGVAVVPARLLADIVDTMPEGEVELATSGEDSVSVESAVRPVRFEVPAVRRDDYPSVSPLSRESLPPLCTVPSDVLRDAIRQTLFACSRDQARPHLTGVSVTVSGTEVVLAATDGARLARRTVSLTRAASGAVEHILPAETLREVVPILAASSGDAEIAVREGQVFILLPAIRIATGTVSGKFPDYEQVIPRRFVHVFRVHTADLLAAVRQASVTARDSSRVVVLDVSPGTLRIESSTPEYGRAEVHLDVRSEGEPVRAAFSGTYLAEGIAAVQTQEVEVGLTGPFTPAVVRPVGDDSYLYVAAPVRLSTEE